MEKVLRFLTVLGAGAVLCALVGFLLWDIRTGQSLPPIPEARLPEPVEEIDAQVPPVPIAQEIRPSETLAASPVQDDLTGPGTIRGKVVRGNVAPERNAEVLLYCNLSTNPSRNPFKRTQSVDGSFTFEALPYGDYTLVASGNNYFGTANTHLGKSLPNDTTNISVYRRAFISGTVMDASGDGIPDADVYVSAFYSIGVKSASMLTEALASLVSTEKDGKYEIGTLLRPDEEYAEYEITARASGYAAKTMPYVRTGTRNWDVILSRGGSASGHVILSGSREPLPHVTVRVASDTVLDGVEVTTDEAGAFFFPSLPAGQHRAQVLHGDMVAVERSATFTVSKDSETTGLSIEMAEGGVISGRLYDVDTGAGIGGKTIQARPAAFTFPFENHRRTDMEGYYEFRGLATGTYLIDAPLVYGYPQAGETVVHSNYAQVKLGAETGGIDFPLSKGLVLSGRVIDTDGNPVAGARAIATDQNYSYNSSLRIRRTGQNGEFVFAGLSPGSNYTIRVDKSGYGAPPGGPYPVSEEGIQDIEIVMERAEGRIEGFVVDSRGRPAPNINVSARSDESDFRGASVPTDQQGRFIIENLLDGKYRLFVSRENYSADESILQTPHINVRSGVTVKAIRLVIESLGKLSISGRVTDKNRKPVVNASIKADGPARSHSVTGPDGQYELGGLSEGYYTLSVFDVRHGQQRQSVSEIAAGSTDVDFVLRGLGIIEGQVRDAFSSEPIIEFGVSFGQAFGFRPFHDIDGRFTLNDVPEGEAVIAVIARGYAESQQTVSGIHSGTTVGDVIFDLEPGASVEGTVADAKGEPVASVLVHRLASSGQPSSSYMEYGSTAWTAADGTFRLQSLPEGPTKITAYHRDYARTFAPVVLDSDSVVHLDILLGQGASVRGIVTSGGTPMAGAYINIALDSTVVAYSTQSDENGYYEFTRLPEARATLIVDTLVKERDGVPGYRSQALPVTILENEVSTINVDFPPLRASLEGTVYIETETALQSDLRATSYVDGTPTESFGIESDSKGYYYFEDLPSGTIVLRIRVQGMTSRTIPLELAADALTRYDVDMLGGTTLSVTAANFPPSTEQAVFVALYGEHDIPSQMDSQNRRSLRRFEAASSVTKTSSGFLQGLEPGLYTIIVGAIPATLDIADLDLLPETTFASTIVEITEGQADTEIVVEF